MKKIKMVKTNEFKELVKESMIEESYGACDVKLHIEQYGLAFKPRASDSEIESRINYFVERVSNKERKNIFNDQDMINFLKTIFVMDGFDYEKALENFKKK